MDQNYSWADKAPIKLIWVDSKAAMGGDGSSSKPYTTIQAAVNKALPGTAIMVREGDYIENVKFARTTNGTQDAPIWLVSADGAGKAHVTAAINTLATISGGGVENIVVDGFHVTGGKNGIQFSQNGYDYTDMINNIVVRNNVIDGIVEDGIKVNGGENVLVSNNSVTGGNDENIDFVGIVHGTIANNDVRGNTGTSAAIFAKGGSTDIRITDNYIHDSRADGISVGGWTDASLISRAGYTGYQAKDVTVSGNRVENVGKRPLSFYGAQDSTATGNYLQATDKYYTVVAVTTGTPTAAVLETSSNITVVDNFITRTLKTLYVDPTSGSVTFANNANMIATAASAGINVAATASIAAIAKLAAAPAAVASAPTAVLKPQSAPVSTATATAQTTEAALKHSALQKLVATNWADSATSTLVVSNGVGTAAAEQIKDKGDILAGGDGDDTYIVSTGFTKIVEAAGGGIDTVLGSGRYIALVDNVENLVLKSDKSAVLIGNSGNNHITGNIGADILIGGGGRDWLEGGGGKDIFFVSVDSPLTSIKDFVKGDVVSITGNPFTSFDELKSSLTQLGQDTVLTLANGKYLLLRDVKSSTLTADDFDFASGGDAIDTVISARKVTARDNTHIGTGTDSAETLYGIGNSVLDGGRGDDTYVVRTGDHVLEHAGGGIDKALVYSASYTIDANVENARIKLDTGATIIGNALSNIIGGGDGADTIRGGAGNDLLTGGKGADVFAFSSAREGSDTITDFTTGVDKLDLRDLTAFYGKVTVSTADTGAGLEVYADHGGIHDMIALLSGVHGTLATADLLI